MENKSLFDVIGFNKAFKKDLFILEYNFNCGMKIFTVFFIHMKIHLWVILIF